MFSAVASTIFAARNFDKTKNGEVGRSAVALGQTAGVIQEVAKYDTFASKTARSALSVFSELAKENKAFNVAGKVTKFAVDNINPLICVSGIIKTAKADDKLSTGITETLALTTMFAGESFVKKYYDKAVNSKSFQNFLTKASEKGLLKSLFKFIEKNKLSGKLGMIIKGLTFVSASISSYSAGEKIGKNIAQWVKDNDEPKINQKV